MRWWTSVTAAGSRAETPNLSAPRWISFYAELPQTPSAASAWQRVPAPLGYTLVTHLHIVTAGTNADRGRKSELLRQGLY